MTEQAWFEFRREREMTLLWCDSTADNLPTSIYMYVFPSGFEEVSFPQRQMSP